MNDPKQAPSSENTHAQHGAHAHEHASEHAQEKEGTLHVAQEHSHTSHAHSAEKKAPARAWAIGGFILIVLVLVGFLIFTKFSMNDGKPIDNVKEVEIKLLVDQNCVFCAQTNTILAKLDESKIVYKLTTIDIHSDEGKKLVKDFDVDYAPTALVNIVGLDQNSTIQAALQGQFIKDPLKIKKGWIIVPEKFLDKQPKLLTFIKAPETCSVNTGKIKIDAQLDFGDCKPCIDAHLILQKLLGKHAQLEVDYDPILYGRTTLKAIGAALQANKGAVCAEKLGYLNDYAACNYFNAQFHGNLDINYMKSCAIEAGMSKNTITNEFVPCVSDINASPAEQTLITNTKTMHAWNPLKYTPSFVIDCTYAFVGQNSIEKYLCMAHPELEGCAQILEDAINPAIDNISTPDTNDFMDLNASTGTNSDANTI